MASLRSALLRPPQLSAPSATRARRRTGRLLLLVMLSACHPSSPATQAPVPRESHQRLLSLGSGLTASLPPKFHEVPSLRGRAFRLRGADKPSFATLSVQYRLFGAPALLDGALEQIVSELKHQGNFDLVDLQMRYVGHYLTLSYTMLFDQLEIPHRQWGMLISTSDGLVGLLMTAPEDGFMAASPEFFDLMDSLVDDTRI